MEPLRKPVWKDLGPNGRNLGTDGKSLGTAGSGASGEYRRHRRDRSQPQPHQLDVTSGARAFMKSAAGDSKVGILSCCVIGVPRARDRFGPIRLLESKINAWVPKWRNQAISLIEGF